MQVTNPVSANQATTMTENQFKRRLIRGEGLPPTTANINFWCCSFTVLLYLYDYDANYGLDLKRQTTQSCRSLREKYVDASKFITNELKLSVESRDFTIPLTLIIFSVTPALFSALHRYDPLTSSGPGLLMVRTCLTLSGELLSWCWSTLNNPRPGNQ